MIRYDDRPPAYPPEPAAQAAKNALALFAPTAHGERDRDCRSVDKPAHPDRGHQNVYPDTDLVHDLTPAFESDGFFFCASLPRLQRQCYAER